MDIAKLQNGSDIRGVALGVLGNEVTLTPAVAQNIGRGLVKHLRDKLNKNDIRVLVGTDSRLSAGIMSRSIMEGICLEKAYAASSGISSTPAMFMSTVMSDYLYDAAVMVTASHLPKDRNGFKFFTKNGGFEKSDIKSILAYASGFGDTYVEIDMLFEREERLMDDYSAVLRNEIIRCAGMCDKPLNGAHIIIDAGNGAGGFFETNVLIPLGADTSGSIFTSPDGNFPNHEPNPENATAIGMFSHAVISNNADLGIIFDTDVDRAAIVFDNGKEVNRNKLIALMGAILIPAHKNAVIVTDSVTSTGLATFLKSRGATHVRFKRGYRNVINEAIKRCNEGQDACLAIETSGHGAVSENYFLDDGAYMAARIIAEFAKLRAQGKSINSLIADLREPAEATEVRIRVTVSDFSAYADDVLDDLVKEIQHWDGCKLASDNYEGVRVEFDSEHGDGWLLLRKSLHDPVMPLNIESDAVGGADIIKAKILAFISRYDGLSL